MNNSFSKILVALLFCFGVSQAHAMDWYVGADFGNFEQDSDATGTTFDSGDTSGLTVGFRQDDKWTYELSYRNYDTKAAHSGTIDFSDTAIFATNNTSLAVGGSIAGVIGAPEYTDGAGMTIEAVVGVDQIIGTSERLAASLDAAIELWPQALFGATTTFIAPARDATTGLLSDLAFVQNVELDGSGVLISVARSWSLADSFDLYGKVGYDSLSVDKIVTIAPDIVSVDFAEVMAEPGVDAIVDGSDSTMLDTSNVVQGIAAASAIEGVIVDTTYSRMIELESGFVYAVGAEWKATPNFSINFEYELSDLARTSLGVKYFFNNK